MRRARRSNGETFGGSTYTLSLFESQDYTLARLKPRAPSKGALVGTRGFSRASARTAVLHLHVRERERPLIGELRDAFVGRPVAMRRLGFDADQYRPVAPLRGLQRRGELERVARDDAVVVVGGGHERGGITGARFDVVE